MRRPGEGAFVDGSAEEGVPWYSWAVCYDVGKNGLHYAVFVIDIDNAACQPCSAEFAAALVAVRLAREAGYRKIALCHDYKGIDVRADMTSRSKKPEIVAYREEMLCEMPMIKVVFQKVKRKNNRAHELAWETQKRADEAYGHEPKLQNRTPLAAC